MSSLKKTELLLPAGNLNKLKTALLYGADAIYAGTPDLSLRSKSSMNLDELLEGVKLVHQQGKKIYLTLNLFARNSDMSKLPNFINTIKTVAPDGLIVADIGVFATVKNLAPQIPLHISTQANICSSATVKMWQQLGAELCVLAREVSFNEFCQIRSDCADMKLEIFIHGAMCMAYSGRCLISNHLSGRAANRGACAHSCRWNYKTYIEEEERPGEFFALEEDDKGSYLMSSKDLCLMPHLAQILAAGPDSLKIEGRNKNEYYVAVTARAYRAAIDDYMANPEGFQFQPYMDELMTLQNRGYTEAFFHGNANADSMTYQSAVSDGQWRTVGIVQKWTEDGLLLLLKNPVLQGDEIEFLLPSRFMAEKVILKEVIDGKDRTKVERLAPGQKDSLLFIPKTFLGNLTAQQLPELTVARKYVGDGYQP